MERTEGEIFVTVSAKIPERLAILIGAEARTKKILFEEICGEKIILGVEALRKGRTE